MATSKFNPSFKIFLGWGAVTSVLAFTGAVIRGNSLGTVIMAVSAVVFIGLILFDFVWRLRHTDR